MGQHSIDTESKMPKNVGIKNIFFFWTLHELGSCLARNLDHKKQVNMQVVSLVFTQTQVIYTSLQSQFLSLLGLKHVKQQNARMSERNN